MKVGKTLLAMLMAVAAVGAARAQSTCLTADDYSKITFTWSGDDGESHTSKLTDVATDPYHIYYLLREVYKNPSVPGILQGGYESDGTTREGDVKYKRTVDGWELNRSYKWGEGYKYDVQPPTQEGYTTLLVKVKDSWKKSDAVGSDNISKSNVISEISKGIESVQLLTDAMRFDGGSNPGTLYKLTGSGNRFFFLSKGRARNTNGSVAERDPFMGMYEEFSPVATNASTGVTDFYSKMMNGDVFSVVHDCGSVLATDHWFSMSGSESSEQKSLDNITFFIPDKRLTAWTDRDKQNGTSGYYYTNYNQSYAPKVSLYTVRLNADTAKVAGTNRYTVMLDWSTSLKEIMGSEIDQVFKLYVVDGNGQKTLLEKDPLTNRYTYSYEVEQKEHGYSITYQITAQPTVNGAGFSEVWSNYAQVAIPGLDPNEALTLGIGGSSTSHYDAAAEKNQYANYVMMNNGVGTNIRGASVSTASRFNFYRINKKSGTAQEQKTLVAVVSISGTSASTISYTVQYRAQDGADNAKYPAKSGTFAIGANDVINFGNFVICDQFSASTRLNDHPDRYTYKVHFAPDGENEKFYSNDFGVKVYKTLNSRVLSTTFTAAEAEGDTQRTLALDGCTVPVLGFAVENDPNIQKYEAVRIGDDGQATAIGRAQHTTSGRFALFEVSGGTETQVGEAGTAADARINHRDYDYTAVESYVPVIYVYAANRDEAPNTYGCDIKSAAAVRLNAQVVKKDVSHYQLQDAGGRRIGARYFSTTIQAATQLPTSGMTVESYRMWRDCGGKAVEEMAEKAYRTNPKQAWFDGFKVARQNVETGVTDYELVDGSAADGLEIVIKDMFGAYEPTATSPLSVTYHVRAYCRADNGKWYVAEAEVPVDYTDAQPTAIDGVEAIDGTLKVYPTVASGSVSVEGAAGQVTIASLTGAVAATCSTHEGRAVIDVSRLAPGCYIVASGGQARRIVKK